MVDIIDTIVCGDCIEVMRTLEPQSVDLVFGSPPYENARSYSMDFNLTGQQWVDWMVDVFKESLRVCRGLVAFVVAGRTKKYKWSCTPALLMADLHRAGICVREPLYYHRVGIPGSGGPDDLRHDIEYIVRATNGGKLPWSDNTATGQPCKYGRGGAMSHRLQDGQRVTSTRGYNDGDAVTCRIDYTPPAKANPGNLIHCIVGGGKMGSNLAHENEAPFPESLAESIIKTYCPPGGIVLDPFSGSGTTAKVACQNGRHYIAIDIRESQTALTNQRIAEQSATASLCDLYERVLHEGLERISPFSITNNRVIDSNSKTLWDG